MQLIKGKSALQHLGFLALAVAIIVRLGIYLANRSLYLDEAFLAFNLMERDWLSLLRPLDYLQAAPIGFLMVSEFVTTLFGFSEYALRLFPVIVSIASCVVLYRLMQQLAPSATVFVLLWFASSNILLQYATEFKQYTLDVFFALILSDLMLRLVRKETASLQLWILWTVIASVAVWFSHPSVFVIAGIGFTVILSALFKRNWIVLRRIIITCAVSAMSFGIVYAGFYQRVASGTALSEHMQSFWSETFFIWAPITVVRFVLVLFQNVIGFEKPFMIGLVVFVFGFVIGLRQLKLTTIGILLLPIPIAMVASSLMLYPLAQRFLLFAVTAIVIIVGVGLTDVYLKVHQANRYVAYLIAFSVLIYLFWGTRLDHSTHHSRKVHQFIEAETDEAIIYTAERASALARFYGYPYLELGQTDTRIVPSNTPEIPIWFVFSGRDDVKFPTVFEVVNQSADGRYEIGDTIFFCFASVDQDCPN